MHSTLHALKFDNSFVRDLPADPRTENVRRQVHKACYSRVQPTPVSKPTLTAFSPEVVTLLGLDPNAIDEEHFAAVFSGNDLLEGMSPFAACYGGHQFGNWADQLGDGRAITLGEVLNSKGERWELQLKGAGPTPYSRMGDGRAVLRSSVREFLCSEAMHHLGVPTTRALSLVTTGDSVVRDMFYDGNARPEPGAIVCRMAPSFLRFGNFEILASRREHDVLETLANYAIRTHFPHLGPPSPAVYAEWLGEICERTATLIARWMAVGFVHGVMNTDNMSILGLTIDYGPYGWLENYDPRWTPNTTDAGGRRYCYGNQPQIALWNLVRFANALAPLVDESAPLEEALQRYEVQLLSVHRQITARKLGLRERPDENDALLEGLLQVFQRTETDVTLFYRHLAEVPLGDTVDDDALLAPLQPAYYQPEELQNETRDATLQWLRRYTQRTREEGRSETERSQEMNAANPRYVLRNYLAQLAIEEAEKGDPQRLYTTLEVLRRPYEDQPGREEYAARRPEWARHRPGCSMLSCSS